jgi:hypothetical protein
MKEIIFIADFFSDQVLGGGELNNDELINLLIKKNVHVKKNNSSLVDRQFIDENIDKFFIIANFCFLNHDCLNKIKESCSYVIYEHDHKYLKSRNPGIFDNFIAPPSELINVNFYNKAKAVFVQSQLHENIVYKNTNLKNLVNLSGNLWSEEVLNLIEEISFLKKENFYAIMDSSIPHKNTIDSIRYCEYKNLDFKLIKNSSYVSFLKQLGINKKLVFFPKTPETLSRIVVESRMMNMGVVTNNMVGATSEDWYTLKGKQLIDVMREKREIITNKIMSYL